TTSASLAGGIRSVQWGDAELVEASDHGRGWQSAFQANGYVDCYNPTEQGAYRDGPWWGLSSSRLDAFPTTPDDRSAAVESGVHPAFWLTPGQRSNLCGPTLNTTDTSEFIFERVTRVGAVRRGLTDVPVSDVIEYGTTFRFPKTLDMAGPHEAEPLTQFVVL